MKTPITVIAIVALFGLQSCKKENDVETVNKQTVEARLDLNQAYTFTLPGANKEDDYKVTTQASHFKLSELRKDASGNTIYHYTPALDYAGTDVVVISNEDNNQSGCGGHHGGGHHDDDDDDEDLKNIITINFSISNPTTISGTK